MFMQSFLSRVVEVTNATAAPAPVEDDSDSDEEVPSTIGGSSSTAGGVGAGAGVASADADPDGPPLDVTTVEATPMLQVWCACLGLAPCDDTA